MTLAPPPGHQAHEWVVDVATHRISRRACAACQVASVGLLTPPAGQAGAAPGRAIVAAPLLIPRLRLERGVAPAIQANPAVVFEQVEVALDR